MSAREDFGEWDAIAVFPAVMQDGYDGPASVRYSALMISEGWVFEDDGDYPVGDEPGAMLSVHPVTRAHAEGSSVALNRRAALRAVAMLATIFDLCDEDIRTAQAELEAGR